MSDDVFDSPPLTYEFICGTASQIKVSTLVASDRQELFSMGIVRATIGAAGFSIGNIEPDRKKTDCAIEFPDVVGDGVVFPEEPRWSRLLIQVKCTFASEISLTIARNDPRILVLVHVPRPTKDPYPWIEANSSHTIVRNRAYWLSLMGQTPVTGQKNVTVKVPISNVFDVSAVHTLVKRMVVQGDKTYEG